jgi:predicted nucleic acid-binding protein
MSLRYLLDTCVLSEFVKPEPEPKVVDWLNSVEAESVYLSAVTFGEIQFGISGLPASNRRTELEVWLNVSLPEQFAGRVLALETDTFVTWGKMTAEQKRKGEPMGIMDSLIAASALENNMVLVTRNVTDFKATDLSILNPWE